MDETKGTHRPQPQAYTSPRWESAPCFSTYLEVYEERKLVATIRIDTRSHFLVGRNAHDCDIVFEPHSKVSRTHAAIVHHTNGEVYVIDLKSGHGTYLNGDQVPANKPTRLVDGYKLEFAKDTGITFTVRVLAGKIPGSEQPKGTLTLLLKEPVMVTALGRDRGTSQGDDEGVPGAGSHGRNGDGGAESPQEGERAAKRRHVADSRGHGHEEGHAPASGKVVRCRHLLLKHVESKNPVTHRVTDTRSADRPDKWQVTRTKEEAVAEIEGLRWLWEILARLSTLQMGCTSYCARARG
eukprot:jgi/Mesvir1/12280/Mv00489-RA.1